MEFNNARRRSWICSLVAASCCWHRWNTRTRTHTANCLICIRFLTYDGPRGEGEVRISLSRIPAKMTVSQTLIAIGERHEQSNTEHSTLRSSSVVRWFYGLHARDATSDLARQNWNLSYRWWLGFRRVIEIPIISGNYLKSRYLIATDSLRNQKFN